ncbi:MAG: YicC family protein [Lachnospiraceae bacterium]|nr:YicC family protein [Lachnospiraceae bacterium]
MIKSMTGFGRCEVTDGSKKYIVEIKAVNHRYLELNTKLQKGLACFDVAVRNTAKEYMERGKVDIFVSMEDDGKLSEKVRYNSDIASQYMEYLKEMADQFGLENDVRLSNLSRYPDVFTMEDESLDEDEQWKTLEKALRGALDNFVLARIEEGTNLKNDLLLKLDQMKGYVEAVEERSPRIVEEYRKKLTERIEELLAPTSAAIDESRIITEVTIFADRVCVDEEIVRLKSHIESMRQCLQKGESCGRKLDFIAQEMNREANTTLSKANDLVLSDTAIELKSIIEKIREQVQNIE